MRKIAKTLLVILGVVVVFEVVDTALHLWAWRGRSPRSLRLVKRYNKHTINPVMLRFSGRSGFSAVVHHAGRRSGNRYATPVTAHRSDQDVIIPLPYGTDVDWLRNLQATGEAVVDLAGHSLEVGKPTVVDIDEVVGLLPASMVRTVRFNGAREAARLHVLGPAAPASA
jgi:deazaflavin-dependent oxidoreductase (nitroreductase family)